jgi:hypothetical protein
VGATFLEPALQTLEDFLATWSDCDFVVVLAARLAHEFLAPRFVLLHELIDVAGSHCTRGLPVEARRLNERENCDVNCDVTLRNLPILTAIHRRLAWSTDLAEVLTTLALDRTSSITVASAPVFC